MPPPTLALPASSVGARPTRAAESPALRTDADRRAWRARKTFTIVLRSGVFGEIELPTAVEADLNAQVEPPTDTQSHVLAMRIEDVADQDARTQIADVMENLLHDELLRQFGAGAFYPSSVRTNRQINCADKAFLSRTTTSFYTQTIQQHKDFKNHEPGQLRWLLWKALAPVRVNTRRAPADASGGEDPMQIQIDTGMGVAEYVAVYPDPMFARDSAHTVTVKFVRLDGPLA